MPSLEGLIDKVGQRQCELVPLLLERFEDLVELLGELGVVRGVLIEVLADVVPDRMLHLGCLGPIGPEARRPWSESPAR